MLRIKVYVNKRWDFLLILSVVLLKIQLYFFLSVSDKKKMSNDFFVSNSYFVSNSTERIKLSNIWPLAENESSTVHEIIESSIKLNF